MLTKINDLYINRLNSGVTRYLDPWTNLVWEPFLFLPLQFPSFAFAHLFSVLREAEIFKVF